MALKARYTVVDGEVIAEKRSGVRHQLVPDPLGSTMALLDNTQTQTDTFTYWPYGEEQSRTGTTATPLRFVGTLGYYRDSSTKTYVRARYLSTQQGRWLTQDPIGFDSGDFNLYRYAENTPVNFQDPSGLIPSSCVLPCMKPRSPECLLCLWIHCRVRPHRGRETCRQREDRGFHEEKPSDALKRCSHGKKCNETGRPDASCPGGTHYEYMCQGEYHSVLCCPCTDDGGYETTVCKCDA